MLSRDSDQEIALSRENTNLTRFNFLIFLHHRPEERDCDLTEKEREKTHNDALLEYEIIYSTIYVINYLFLLDSNYYTDGNYFLYFFLKR
jgi:hypothetical protein